MKKKSLTVSANRAGSAIGNNPLPFLYIALGLAGIYTIYSWSQRLSNFSLGNADGAGGGINDANAGNAVPFGATISKNQAQNIASALYQEMVKFFGTDGDIVIDLLAGKKPRDFAMISEAFGRPRYDGHGEAFWPFPPRPLSYWLFSELNDEETRRLRQLMPNVL